MTDPLTTEKTGVQRLANEQAAEWYLKFKFGDLDEDHPEYAKWLVASPENKAAMERARATWSVFGEYAASPEVVKVRRDALHRSGKRGARRWGGFRFLPGQAKAIVATFVIAVALSVYYIGGGIYSPQSDIVTAQRYETDIGETRVITLADNSRVSLDASTHLQVNYTANARDIELLSGQAYFDVAHNPERPFRVKVGQQTVVATGTAFNVEMVNKEILVTLLEGEVVVASSEEQQQSKQANTNPTVKLKPGQLLVKPKIGLSYIKQDINLEKTTAWRDGRVFLDGDNLVASVARMNRYSKIRLSVADKSLENLRISGIFHAGDINAFVQALEAYFPLEARRMTASSIELHPRS